MHPDKVWAFDDFFELHVYIDLGFSPIHIGFESIHTTQ